MVSGPTATAGLPPSPGRRRQVDLVRPALRKPRRELVGPVADQPVAARVREEPAQPEVRPGRVERQVGRTALDDRQQRHDQLGGAVDADADHVARGQPVRAEPVGEVVREAVHLAVAERALAVDDRGRVRKAVHDAFEDVLDARVGGKGRVGGVDPVVDGQRRVVSGQITHRTRPFGIR